MMHAAHVIGGIKCTSPVTTCIILCGAILELTRVNACAAVLEY